MAGPVVLDGQPAALVVEVDSTDKPSSSVVNWSLDIGPGQSAEYQKHTESRFHRRL